MDKKKLNTLFLLGTIGVIGLSISFSLAWYAYGDTLKVQTVNIELDTDRDLKISTSSALDSFKDKLVQGEDDIKMIDLFYPVSSMLDTSSHSTSNWIEQKASKPEFRNSSNTENLHGESIASVIDYGFYSQEFYLLCDDDVYVTLDANTSKFLPDEEENKLVAKQEVGKQKYEGLTEQEILKELNDLTKCLRISILDPDIETYKYTIIDPYKEGTTKLGGLLDNSANGYYDTYVADDSETYEIIYGEVYNRDKLVYNDITGIDVETTGRLNAFNAKHLGSAHLYNEEASTLNGFRIATENSLSLNDLKGVDSKLRIPVKANEPKKIVLSVYLEGWDKDCINSTMGASFINELTFKILREQ